MTIEAVWAVTGIAAGLIVFQEWHRWFGVKPAGVAIAVTVGVLGPFGLGVAWLLRRIDPVGRWG